MRVDDLIPVTFRQMESHPRRQPTVTLADILRFILGDAGSVQPDTDESTPFVTIETARAMLGRLIHSTGAKRYDITACQRLLHWLHAYEHAQNVLLN